MPLKVAKKKHKNSVLYMLLFYTESSFMSGMHMGGMRPEPQGEKGPSSTGQQHYSADFLSGENSCAESFFLYIYIQCIPNGVVIMILIQISC